MSSGKLLLAVLLGGVLAGAAVSAPVETRLTADEMDYDMESGDFKARGRVTLVREGVTIKSTDGAANTKTQFASMWGNVSAFGEYRGEPLDAKCDRLDVDFAAEGGDYRMNGAVDATFGPRVLRSDTARLAGQNFSAEKVTHFEDKTRNAVLICDSLVGSYDGQGLLNATGCGSVDATREESNQVSNLHCDRLVYDRAAGTTVATGHNKLDVRRTDGTGAQNTVIECDRMVQDWAANTVTATGNARAVQDGRDLRAETLIYHPDTGRVEAMGKPRITVDLNSLGNGSSRKVQPSRSTPRRNAGSTNRSRRKR